MRKRIASLFLTILAIAPCAADAANTFSEISEHHEAIRQALMKDSADGVADHSRAIRDAAAALREDFTAERAEVSADNAETARALLPEVEKLASDLAAASGLKEARVAFAELTKPLVRWQALVTGPRPMVVYCPMEKKSWLQPDEPVGNPYAPSMLRCGEVVAR